MYRNNVLLFEVENIIVNAGLPAFAQSFAGVDAYNASAIGFGSGATAVSVNDTDLTGPQKYYNAIGSASYPSAGTVQFAFAIQSTDYAANNENIQELGMFANAATVGLPAVSGFSYSAWSATASQSIGNLVTDGSGHVFRSSTPPAWPAGTTLSTGYTILDSNGNLQQVTTGGTTKGSPHPSWATTPVGTTTSDNTVTWTLRAIGAYTPTSGGSTPSWVTSSIGSSLTFDGTTLPVVWTYIAQSSGLPSPMTAHATVPAFSFSGGAAFTGTWAITF
jgi:hypothetical protein